MQKNLLGTYKPWNIELLWLEFMEARVWFR